MKTTMATLKAANWDQLERDVVERIRALRVIAMKLDRPQVVLDPIANDLILPNLQLLGEFCQNVKL